MLPSRVLIIARGFPPYIPSLGGAVRMLKLAEFLTNRGIETHVLAGRGRHHGDFGYADVLQRLNVHYIDDPMLKLGGPTDAAVGPAGIMSRLKQKVKPLVLDLSVPDIGIVALSRLAGAARKLLDRHDISTVISSGPPHSDHLVGLRLKRLNPRLNWIVDYRDSWNGTALFRKRFAPAQWLNLSLERQVLRAADYITTISPPMAGKAAAIAGLPAENGKFRLVMNGFDDGLNVDPAAWRNDNGPLRIGYFGYIDDRPGSYRDPSGFFETMIRSDLPVSFELFGAARVDPAWQTRLGGRLRVHGNLPHAAAVEEMARLDVLMLLHTRQEGADEVVTGKVFEYIAAGRPVLSVGPANMAVNAMCASDPMFHAVTDDDPGALVTTLRALAEAKAGDRLGVRPRAAIERYSRGRQYENMLDLLH